MTISFAQRTTRGTGGKDRQCDTIRHECGDTEDPLNGPQTVPHFKGMRAMSHTGRPPRGTISRLPTRRALPSRSRLGWSGWGLLVVCLGWTTIAVAQRPGTAPRNRGRRDPVTPVEGVVPARGAESAGVRQASGSSAGEASLEALREGPLAKLVAVAEQSQQALDEISDYTAVFSRKELVKRRLVEQKMEMKFRQQPFSVYFRFVSPDEAGREVIYVDGRHRNQLVVHETGLKAIAGTMTLPLNDPRVVQESRHPITSVGLHNIMKKAFDNFPRDAADPEVELKKYPKAKLEDGRACVAFVLRHPNRQPAPLHYETHLYFDQETLLPVHIERYDWPRAPGQKPVLVESYTYSKIRTNVGLNDVDFDPRNPRYQFP